MMITAGSQPVLQHEASYSLLVKKSRIIRSFMGSKRAVAAARANDNRCTSGFSGLGQVGSQRGYVFVCGSQCTGSAVRPQREWLCRLARAHYPKQADPHQDKNDSHWPQHTGSGLQHEVKSSESVSALALSATGSWP